MAPVFQNDSLEIDVDALSRCISLAKILRDAEYDYNTLAEKWAGTIEFLVSLMSVLPEAEKQRVVEYLKQYEIEVASA